MMDKGRVVRIVVANAKGGCGKTTVATNLAGAYAAAGKHTALFDFDPQGSSIQWLKLRPTDLPEIQGVPAYPNGRSQVTKTFALRIAPHTERVVVDTPAGLKGLALRDQIKGADIILVPVSPSPIDMLATADFVKELLMVRRGCCPDARIALIANRVKKSPKMRESLKRFLGGLDVPVLGQIRDAESYLLSAENGIGVAEQPLKRGRQEKQFWRQLREWIDTPPTPDESAESAAELGKRQYQIASTAAC